MTKRFLISLFLLAGLPACLCAQTSEPIVSSSTEPSPDSESFHWYRVTLKNKITTKQRRISFDFIGPESPEEPYKIKRWHTDDVDPGNSAESRMYLSDRIVTFLLYMQSCKWAGESLPDCTLVLSDFNDPFFLAGQTSCENIAWGIDDVENTLDVVYSSEGDERSITITLADPNCCGDSPDCSSASRLSGPFWKLW